MSILQVFSLLFLCILMTGCAIMSAPAPTDEHQTAGMTSGTHHVMPQNTGAQTASQMIAPLTH